MSEAASFLRSVIDRVAERSSLDGTYSLSQWKGQNCAMSQTEVAKLFGVTRAMIYLIEKRALGKLRKAILADPELRNFFK